MYKELEIKKMMEKINRNEVYLPAIQRKFVWDPEQIESLFDSIMRGYPIGTFLFWVVKGEEKNNYTFYKFIQEYHDRDNYLNEIAPQPELKDEIIGVLDGQQRLGSMYLSLQGSYAYKKPYGRWENDGSFPKRKFYVNLLKEGVQREAENFAYEFKFLADNKAKRMDKNHLWFSVRDVFSWGEDPKIDEYYDNVLETDIPLEIKEIIKIKKNLIKRTLRILHQRLVLQRLINYYEVEEQDLDEILEIFVRVNSGGTILSKSDLLFSTIVVTWERARAEIEALLETINSKGERFWFDNDFVMRACLVLTDSPVLFKVKGFKKENVEKIKREWKNIKQAIESTVNLLVKFGFNGENLTSLNAVIPITYHIMKGGSLDETPKNELRKYLIGSLVKKTYGAQGDRVLAGIRETLRKKENGNYVLKDKNFSLKKLTESVELPGTRTLEITDEDIEEMLEYRKGPYSFMILSLLYPNLRFGQVSFHQDHVHPAGRFTKENLRRHGVSEEKWEIWQWKDQLPNLQLMEGKENERKKATPFKDWLHGKDSKGNSNVPDVDKFLKDNYIPNDVSLEFKDFETFYETRKKMLKEKITSVLS